MYRRPAIETDEGVEYANLSASGSLWKDALIMRDDVSHSMWSQLEGWAVKGSLEGEKLESYPFERMTYAAWKTQHPNTLVLEKGAREAGRQESVYADYFSDDEQLGIFGTENPDDRVPGKALVLGFLGEDEQVAVPMHELRQKGWVRFQLDGRPAIALHDAPNAAVRGFRVSGEARVDEAGGGVIVVGDDRWDLDGAPRADGLAELEPLLHTPVFWFAWVQGFPQTRVVHP